MSPTVVTISIKAMPAVSNFTSFAPQYELIACQSFNTLEDAAVRNVLAVLEWPRHCLLYLLLTNRQHSKAPSDADTGNV